MYFFFPLYFYFKQPLAKTVLQKICKAPLLNITRMNQLLKSNSHLDNEIELFFFFCFDRLIFAENFSRAADSISLRPLSEISARWPKELQILFWIPSRFLSGLQTEPRHCQRQFTYSSHKRVCKIPAATSRVFSLSEAGLTRMWSWAELSGSGLPDVPDITEACQLCSRALNGSLSLISHSSFTMTPLFSWYYSTPGGSLWKVMARQIWSACVCEQTGGKKRRRRRRKKSHVTVDFGAVWASYGNYFNQRYTSNSAHRSVVKKKRKKYWIFLTLYGFRCIMIENCMHFSWSCCSPLQERYAWRYVM